MIKFKKALKNIKKLRKHFSEAVSQDKINLEMGSFFRPMEGFPEELAEGWEEANDEYSEVDFVFSNSFLSGGSQLINPCNSSCCIVGYAAISGVEDFKPAKIEGWDEYTSRLFVPDESDDGEVNFVRSFSFLFGAHQSNVKEAAIYRLDVAILKMKRIIVTNEGSNQDKWEEFNEWCRLSEGKIDDKVFYPSSIQDKVDEEEWV